MNIATILASRTSSELLEAGGEASRALHNIWAWKHVGCSPQGHGMLLHQAVGYMSEDDGLIQRRLLQQVVWLTAVIIAITGARRWSRPNTYPAGLEHCISLKPFTLCPIAERTAQVNSSQLSFTSLWDCQWPLPGHSASSHACLIREPPQPCRHVLTQQIFSTEDSLVAFGFWACLGIITLCFLHKRPFHIF